MLGLCARRKSPSRLPFTWSGAGRLPLPGDAVNLAVGAARSAGGVFSAPTIPPRGRPRGHPAAPAIADLTPLLAAWVGFGLFTIGCSVLVALHADRLSHRRKQAVL